MALSDMIVAITVFAFESPENLVVLKGARVDSYSGNIVFGKTAFGTITRHGSANNGSDGVDGKFLVHDY